LTQEPELIGVGIPHNGWVTSGLAASLATLQLPFNRLMILQKGHAVDLARNMIASMAMKQKCTKLFFIDSDIRLEPDTFVKLWRTDLPIISATYFERTPPYKAVARFNGEPYTPEFVKQVAATESLVEAHEVGMGAILIDMRIFQRLGQKINKWVCLVDHTKEVNKMVASYSNAQALAQNYECSICHNLLICPFFQSRNGFFDDNPVSEDFAWSKSVRELGFQIYISPQAIVHHVTTVGDFEIGIDGPKTTMSHLGLAGARL